LEKELAYLSRIREAHEHPFLVLLGGAKASDKLAIVTALARRADQLLIGGGMAYTFLRAQGQEIGASLVEPDRVAEVRALLEKARPGQLVLPVDHVQDELAGARFFEQRANFGNPIGLDQRGADLLPLCAQEGVRHAAADQKLVGAPGERGHDGKLVA